MTQMTVSQTIGPFWHVIDEPDWRDLTRFGADGEAIKLEGRISDGTAAAVADAAVELFQVSPKRSPTFPGYGRTATDGNGVFRFITVKPGPVPGPRGANVLQAPHCGLVIFARGLLRPLFTRLYFPNEQLNETDPILALIDPSRRCTLIAAQTAPSNWRLDIVLQGEGETVFLDF